MKNLLTDESAKPVQLTAKQLAILGLTLCCTVLLATAALCFDSYSKSKAEPLPATGAVAVVEPTLESAPVAEAEHLPAATCVCRCKVAQAPCTLRHYPASTAPFTVLCTYCRRLITVAPPSGGTGQVGDTEQSQ